MIANLSRYINQRLFVSIPALFEDGYCRPYTLLGVEINGLWLQSNGLTNRLLPDESRDSIDVEAVAAFVPFAQIAGVLVAATLPDTSPPPARTRDEGAPPPPSTTEAQGRSGANASGRPPKQPKKR